MLVKPTLAIIVTRLMVIHLCKVTALPFYFAVSQIDLN